MLAALQTVISEGTLIPLGIACAVLAPVCAWLIWLNGRLASIQSRLATIEGQHHETWSFTQQENWALKLGRANPALRVPDPEPSVVGDRRRTDAP